MMDHSERKDEELHVQQTDCLETYNKKRRISWWINAIGWWTLGLGVFFWAAFKSKLLFGLGFTLGVGLIAAGIIYDIMNKLYKCPYCGGFLLRKTKCRNCGIIVVTIHQ